jgi:LysM repeat protein
MGMTKYLIIAVFLMLGVSAAAQPADAKTEVINGKTYYVHIVEQGNTLYGIHKLYNVAPEIILATNPGMSDQLEIGQRVLIPVSSEAASAAKTIQHTVVAGETLYGISKKYKCTLDEITKLNPGVDQGLSVGQILTIPNKDATEFIPTDPVIEKPNYKLNFTDSIVMHTVMPQETMYSISKRFMVSIDTILAANGMKSNKIKPGDVIRIPLKKVSYTILEKDLTNLNSGDTIPVNAGTINKKSVYNVALILPFMIDANEAEMAKMLRPGQNRELHPTTKIVYAFYQGFIMAADSLKKAGLHLNLHVYDTKQDTARLIKLFDQPEFATMDLVIGPLHEKMVRHATRLCKEKGIRIVLPFRAPATLLQENPSVYSCVSSNMTLMDGMVDYVVNNMSHYNVFIIKPFSTADKALYDRARDRYNTLIQGKTGAMNPAITEIDLGDPGGRQLNAQLRKDTVNVILVPSEDVKFVSGALSRMNQTMNLNPYAKKMKIIAFGLEDWNSWEDIDFAYRNRTYQHYASYRYIDFNEGRGKKFVKAFRGRYGIDPDIFATQGFDVGLYFLSALQLYGVNFDPFLTGHNPAQVQNQFKFVPVSQGSGNENRGICVAKYDNFKLIRVY